MTIRHHVMRYKTPYNAAEGVCGVSIFQSRPDMAVVVLTEVQGNPGMSVTNAVEYIATKAKRAFLPNVAQDQVIWVERYEKAANEEVREVRDEKAGAFMEGRQVQIGETFDLVTFKFEEDGYASPSWRPIGNRDANSFWKTLFQSDKPLDTFPNFAEIGASIR